MTGAPAATSVTRQGVRQMVKELHRHTDAQKQSVTGCRRIAETFTTGAMLTSSTAEGAMPSVEPSDAPQAGGAAAATPVCFAEVVSKAGITQSMVLDGPLSGIVVAVSDALTVQEFHSRFGIESPAVHRVTQREVPLVSWLRRQGASFVGKLSCRTPLALKEGCVFDWDKPASVAVAAGACHYSINCSLIGPSSVASCVGQDVVGFKPTTQTIGTFAERHELPVPFMTVGVTATSVDDLLYLWQIYTAAIDPGAFFESEVEDGTAAPEGAAQETPKATPEAEQPAEGVATADKDDSDRAAAARRPDRLPSDAQPELLHRDVMDDYRPPVGGTTKSTLAGLSGGRMADIDVGWRDYNAAAASDTDGFIAKPRGPGLVRRLLYGGWSRHEQQQQLQQQLQQQRQQHISPRVELAVGYPFEWIDERCQRVYGSSEQFHRRLTDAVYHRSAMHRSQKLEIVPLAFDFEIDDVVRACDIISHFELAKAFGEPAAAPAAGGTTTSTTNSSSGTPSPPAAHPRCSYHALSSSMGDLPRDLVEAVEKGQRLRVQDYNSALRVRDDVVRALEEQFQDVDALVVPVLSEPFVTGDVRSIALTLPFHLAGNPMLSMQMDADLPIAMVGELGRDTALLEDAICFLQFVRGSSPNWLKKKVFMDSVDADKVPVWEMNPPPKEAEEGASSK